MKTCHLLLAITWLVRYPLQKCKGTNQKRAWITQETKVIELALCHAVVYAKLTGGFKQWQGSYFWNHHQIYEGKSIVFLEEEITYKIYWLQSLFCLSCKTITGVLAGASAILRLLQLTYFINPKQFKDQSTHMLWSSLKKAKWDEYCRYAMWAELEVFPWHHTSSLPVPVSPFELHSRTLHLSLSGGV